MKSKIEWIADQDEATKKLSEAVLEAMYQDYLTSLVIAAFTGYDAFDSIKADIPARVGFPVKDEAYSVIVIGIESAKVIPATDKKQAWCPVVCTIEAGGKYGSHITLFGSDLVNAEAEIGMTMLKAGRVRVTRSADGIMSYATA